MLFFFNEHLKFSLNFSFLFTKFIKNIYFCKKIITVFNNFNKSVSKKKVKFYLIFLIGIIFEEIKLIFNIFAADINKCFEQK